MVTSIEIRAADGYLLGATQFGGGGPTIVVNPAVAVPAAFYRRMAQWLADRGFTVITWDYRGVGASLHGDVRHVDASLTTWVAQDMAAVVEHAAANGLIHLIGHSLGGQLPGMLPDPTLIRSMATIVAQSGHWRLQGDGHRLRVAATGWLVLPIGIALSGKGPFSRLGFGEDLPAAAARQWSRWIRHPDYLFGDASLPLDRYARFEAPILAWSVDDDPWGTAASVDDMMGRYPNVERRHLVPAEVGMDAIGHMGAFRPGAKQIWAQVAEWFRGQG